MSDALVAAPSPRPRPVSHTAPATSAVLRDPAERGTTTVADRVIEKVAATAAGEVARTAELGRRLSERLPGRTAKHARATALVSGRLVQLRVTVGVEYPVPIVRVTRDIRGHVRDTVSRLCDVDVRDVDIVVSRLRRPGGQGRRVI